MGLDLTLVFHRLDILPDILAYDRLALWRSQDLFREIKDIPSQPLEMRFTWYEDDGLVERTTDPYGAPLRWCWASDLAKLEITQDMHPWNAAVLAFVRALPPELKIVLWWC